MCIWKLVIKICGLGIRVVRGVVFKKSLGDLTCLTYTGTLREGRWTREIRLGRVVTTPSREQRKVMLHCKCQPWLRLPLISAQGKIKGSISSSCCRERLVVKGRQATAVIVSCLHCCKERVEETDPFFCELRFLRVRCILKKSKIKEGLNRIMFTRKFFSSSRSFPAQCKKKKKKKKAPKIR